MRRCSQVLLSIQAQVLNDMPYRNEPAYERAQAATCEAYNRDVRSATARIAILDAIPDAEGRAAAGHVHAPEFDEVVRTHFRLKAAAIVRQLEDWAQRDAAAPPFRNSFPVDATSRAMSMSWPRVIADARRRFALL